MELSIVLIAVVFLVPFALAFALLGAMAADSSWASRPVITLPKATRRQRAGGTDNGRDGMDHCVPA